ncbi:ArsR/SmtB family transcription factor [Paractinoplanes maris]|uniref:ArsR/SmtB family transcription factor n=1 Tax=Paractinoplanes maris TaxID=1734446 RepID=UPI002021F475|nr:metalloregulator ArsR/SmtB family transcription factor [Actinoplanes maris]
MPSTDGPGVVISAAALAKAADALRGMAYEHRLQILVILRAGETTPSMLAAAIPAHPTAVSHHLRHLLDSRLVQRRRQGRRTLYSLRDEATARLVDEVLRYVQE